MGVGRDQPGRDDAVARVDRLVHRAVEARTDREDVVALHHHDPVPQEAMAAAVEGEDVAGPDRGALGRAHRGGETSRAPRASQGAVRSSHAAHQAAPPRARADHRARGAVLGSQRARAHPLRGRDHRVARLPRAARRAPARPGRLPGRDRRGPRRRSQRHVRRRRGGRDLVRARRLRRLAAPARARLRADATQAQGPDRLQRHHRAAHGHPAPRGPRDLSRPGGLAGLHALHPGRAPPRAVARGDTRAPGRAAPVRAARGPGGLGPSRGDPGAGKGARAAARAATCA